MEYDIQFSCCSCKITEIEGNTSWENRNKKKHMYDSMEPVSKKRFLEDIKRNIQLWMLERRKDYFLNSMGN